MSISNRDRVGKGLDLLREGLLPYVEGLMQAKFGTSWRDVVGPRFELRKSADGNIHWDKTALLRLFQIPEVWRELLEPVLGKTPRSYASELIDVRNRHSHDETFTSEQASRALDTMRLLLEAIGAGKEAEAVQQIHFDLQRQVYEEQARNKVRYSSSVEGAPQSGLRPWRDIVTPHPDVASGQYVQAEFAADLHNVHAGIGGPEYTDPVEFFRRTYITDGLRELLTGALQRLAGKGGDPVVELQTNFGGGKTHSMLALYHLFGGTKTSSLPGLEEVLRNADVLGAPKANRAVLVGTHLSAGEISVKPDGTRVRTLWGEMAWQLGGAEGFAFVADSDVASTSPGAAVLANLFRKYSPALVLIDEWVAYARNTVDRPDLPSGDFGNQDTFAQALTEAAKAADGTLVVASIPASKIEVGGTNGEFVLATLKNVFERLGTPWRPASADEGFEIVRRRLFEPVTGRDATAQRDAVVDAFARMYQDNKADFPPNASEAGYKRKLQAAYPIHPDVFDLLYGEWSTLDKFQRTRGVLRLLAKVIHRLWESNDQTLLLMPSSFPMDDAGVKSELTRYLDDQWEPIISEDVDGPHSLPLELDRANAAHLGRYSACRRVARTLYMGTAPGARGKNPGIDDRRVRLGCTQPGENPSTFGDALRRISDRAKHIHQDQSRYWISTKPNLNRLADDRASMMLQRPEELHAEIVRRIRDEYNARNKVNRGEFVGVHPCPETTAEVADDPEARLVILGPEYDHRKGVADTKAMLFARKLLDQRGNSPRLNRNMLVFLVAETPRLDELVQATAQYLAWKGIDAEKDPLNLDSFQRTQAENKFKDLDSTVDSRIKETWTLTLVPVHREPTTATTGKPEDLVGMDEIRTTGSDVLARRVSAKLKSEGQLLPNLGGVTLRAELDNWLWKEKNHVTFGLLAEWFARYLYLPRIVNRDVLVGAVRDALGQSHLDDTFAVASAFDEASGRYKGLVLRGNAGALDNAALLVKPAAAKAQVEADEEAERARLAAIQPVAPVADNGGVTVTPTGTGPATVTGGGQKSVTIEPAVQKKVNLFVGSVKLDGSRLGRDAGKIAEEVLQHLSTLPGAEVEVRLEILVRVPGGVGDDVVRTVSENARTLKFTNAGFERE